MKFVHKLDEGVLAKFPTETELGNFIYDKLIEQTGIDDFHYDVIIEGVTTKEAVRFAGKVFIVYYNLRERIEWKEDKYLKERLKIGI